METVGGLATQQGWKYCKTVAMHLGTGGSSCAAIKDGHSLDTTMGFSPLQGLVMSTRCGDLDPTIVIELLEHGRYSPEQLTRLFNSQSGLLGLSAGKSSDIRDLLKLEHTDDQCALAVSAYVDRIRHYIGAYAVALQGLDMLVFTDDVGLKVPEIRKRVCAGMEWLGVKVDEKKNEDAVAPSTPVEIQASDSRVTVLVVPNDEESVIFTTPLSLL
eukprot:GCRY01007472.1.p1 GENE.GCRY01007472.1~~GCRY01007472.1.p1  ORF type:complete len:215 (+),score=67.32 GCRY01007472.1:636-1280(+)